MFRLGGIVLGLICFVTASYFVLKPTPVPQELTSPSAWIDRQLESRKPQWILPETDLKIVQLCSGVLDEDYGYDQPTPKLIFFFESEGIEPKIISSKMIDRLGFDHQPIEISSLNVRDLNHDLLYRSEGVFGEHGQLEDLKYLDHINKSRRLDTLLEEAAELCTAGIWDYRQKQLEMDKLKEKIESRASAYVYFEYSAQTKGAELEIIYQLDDLVFRSLIHQDFRIL